MRFEHIAMQANDGKDAAALRNKFTDVLIAGVVKTPLRQDDSHTTAGFEEVQVALDKQHITANLVLPFTSTVFAKLIMRNYCVFLDIASKRRICHHEVKLELAIILHTSRLKLLQFLKAKRLPVDAVSFTDEITECDGKLNFYIPINFDPDAVFGTNVASAFNDDWLNVYANFGWKTGRIDSALTVCLVCSDGHEFEFFYPLTSAEQVQLWNQMDAYCHQQNGQSLGETRTALLREQAEEGLEIRL